MAKYKGSIRGRQITLAGPCSITGIPHEVTVPLAQYERWKQGMLIQKAMPDVPPHDREFLVSGVSPKGWEVLFGAPENDA
jgi:hypothetical protein